jgi:hypothetical protein
LTIPRFIGMFGRHLLPVLQWRMNWHKHDHKSRHVHFGPLAVDHKFQGRGVGKALLGHFCEYLDNTGQSAYLETDKQENVALYEKFGLVVSTDHLFGVKPGLCSGNVLQPADITSIPPGMLIDCDPDLFSTRRA